MDENLDLEGIENDDIIRLAKRIQNENDKLEEFICINLKENE